MSLTLHAIFGHHAVLQRGVAIPFRGRARPGSGIVVHFAGLHGETRAGADGAWEVRLGPFAAGGPYVLQVDGGSEGVERREDIHVGEVWFCSGQSNMEWPLAQAEDADADIFAAREPHIRFATIEKDARLDPLEDTHVVWKVCSPETAGGCSAVAYHFARKLAPELRCPIGLIISAWGGTMALPWTPLERIEDVPEFADFARVRREVKTFAPPSGPLVLHEDTGDAGTALGWARPDFDDAAWPEMDQPGFWQARGHRFNGAVWFRRRIGIPETWRGRELVLQLGALDDFDETHWNGVRVGGHGKETPGAYALRRRYIVPAALTDCAEAVIAVRIFDNFGNGGFAGPAGALALQVSDGGAAVGTRLPLAGPWRFRVERAIPLPVREGVEGQAVPSALYNAMVHPFIHVPLRGFLWYQGESDVVRAHLYRRMLGTLIAAWRERWALGDLPFLIVQIAPFGSACEPGDESPQADLREAQAQVATLPNTALASTVDCGDAFDIHPVDKRTVGVRLALAALRLAYDRDVEHSGPVLAGASRDGRAVRVRFRHASGLRARTGLRTARGFALCGDDGAWREATGEIDGESVVVAHADIPCPVELRYGWGDVPLVELENAARLPAAPFRVTLP